jgi:hypothetical protein
MSELSNRLYVGLGLLSSSPASHAATPHSFVPDPSGALRKAVRDAAGVSEGEAAHVEAK